MKRRCMVSAPSGYAASRATINDQPFGQLFESILGREYFEPAVQQRSRMPMSSWQDETSLTVEVDLPGVKLEDVSIEVHNKVLTISAKRTAESRDGGWDNRRFGEFVEKLQLPDTVDENGVFAKLAHGVLVVKVPKVEQPKPFKVSISVEG